LYASGSARNNFQWRDQMRQHYHIHEAIVLKRLLLLCAAE
jgi:hypothetical protein